MAVTIGEIPNDATTPIDGNELMELEQDGGSVKALVADIRNDGVREVSDDYTITGRADSRIVQVTTGATDRDCFLPAGSGLEAGDEFEYMKVDSGVGTATLKAQGSNTIDGVAAATGVILYSRRNKIRVRWTGSEFTVLELQSSRRVAADEYYDLHADGTVDIYVEAAVSAAGVTYNFPLTLADAEFIVSGGAREGGFASHGFATRTTTSVLLYGSTAGQSQFHIHGRWRA